LYLRVGDKKSAISEYQKAAGSLSGEGFNLKAISIYKKILTLDSMSMRNHKFLAALYTEEGLLAEARRTYEKILQIRPEDRETREALAALERGEVSPSDRDIRNTFEMGETQAIDDSDPVPIETLIDPSERDNAPSDPFANLMETSQDGPDMGEEVDERENAGEDFSPGERQDTEIDLSRIQTDDVLDVSGPPEEEEAAGQSSLHGTVVRDLTAEDISNTDFQSEEIETPTLDSPAFDTSQSSYNTVDSSPSSSGEDPNLHYHLGVAYREMDLTDKAIEEFRKALEQGTKPLECLIMLARCHFEKGLFQEAADFIHRALKLEDLSQEQINQLHRQLDEVQAVGNLE